MVSEMKQKYTTTFEVKWADVDPNLHLRHTVYLDYADQTRIRFFNENALSFNRLMSMGLGPILFGTQTDFKREVLLNERITIDCELIDITDDGRKWTIKHIMYKESGEVAAEMVYRGAWFNLRERKVVAPPKEVYNTMVSFNSYKYEKEES